MGSVKTIALGADHAGYEFKQRLIETLKSWDYEVQDLGAFSPERVDYPDFAHGVARAVENQSVDRGILLCGSGNGVCMTANKHAGIRAALCWSEDITRLARQHNDANVLCLPARFLPMEKIVEMARIFLETEFEGGRHQARVEKICL